MPVSTKHSEYDLNKDKWRLVRDCVEGSSAVKAARGGGTGSLYALPGSKYLPPPNATDESLENQMRYKAYRERASFVNFTGHTKDGFSGMIGRKESEKELPPEVEYLIDNANGAGLSLSEVEQRLISELMEAGRHGLLVDFPTSQGGSVAQTSGLQAAIKCYTAENILNWRTENVNGKTQLSMVVLCEQVEKDLDGFDCELVKQYRVLRLIDGAYWQLLYDEDENLIGEYQPRKADGSLWQNIPFVIAGSIDNGPSVDKATLYDLAELNIAHYRNSADFEESSFMVGQPTPVFSGLTQAWVQEVLSSGIQLGSRTGVLLPDGGSGALLQANENQMPSKGMEVKEQQMIKTGAKIITDAGGTETAEAAKIRFAGQNSKLGLLVCNAEKALIDCIQWALEFMGGAGAEVVYSINKQFYDASIDPQLVVAQIQLMDRAIIAKSDVRGYLRKAGMIDPMRTDDDIDGEAEEINPLL